MSKTVYALYIIAELGVDSAEMRELFLSKIYDLCNPSRNLAEMQDDFRRKFTSVLHGRVPYTIISLLIPLKYVHTSHYM